jgi:hypothetical protein
MSNFLVDLWTGKEKSSFALPYLSYSKNQRRVFLLSYSAFTLFHLGGSLGRSASAVLACRLLGGIFGSSREILVRPAWKSTSNPPYFIALTNAGGAISDIWSAREREFIHKLPFTYIF